MEDDWQIEAVVEYADVATCRRGETFPLLTEEGVWPWAPVPNKRSAAEDDEATAEDEGRKVRRSTAVATAPLEKSIVL